MVVSIIMACYNSSSTICDSVDSVIKQSYKNWELIICDDSSTDNSVDLVEAYKDTRIKLVKNINLKGAAGARNTAIEYATGHFLCFLDSDDIWCESKLASQVDFMKTKNVAFSYTGYLIFSNDPRSPVGRFDPKPELGIEDLLCGCDIGCSTVMLDRGQLPDFMFPYSAKEDYAAWVLLAKRGTKAYRSPGFDMLYRNLGQGVSSNKLKEVFRQYKVLRVYGELSFFKAITCLMKYSFNGFVKHYLNYRSF